MAAAEEKDGGVGNEIPPWASGDNLRHVEREVLIPKIVRERARERCKDLVEEFTKCCKGRTVSMVWVCRKENRAMKDCLTKHYLDKELFEESRIEYLHRRQEYQENYARTGGKKELQKKNPVMM